MPRHYDYGVRPQQLGPSRETWDEELLAPKALSYRPHGRAGPDIEQPRVQTVIMANALRGALAWQGHERRKFRARIFRIQCL